MGADRGGMHMRAPDPDAGRIAPRTGGRRVAPLDGVRGIAILAVLAFHFVYEAAPGGAFGVDLFFVLSAFLITGILVREYDATARMDMAAFYVRRAARLLPALALFLLVIAPPIAFVIGTVEGIPLSSLAVALYVADFGRAGYFPFTDPYGHTWSLAVEEQFYLVWPIALLLVLKSRIKLVPLGVALFVGGALVTWAGSVWLGIGPNYFLPTGHLPAFGAGALAAFIALRLSDAAIARVSSSPLAIAGVVGLALVFVLPRADWPLWAQNIAPLPVLLLAGCLILHAASGRRSLVNSGLSMAWLRWFGTRSYGIYLYHAAFYELFSNEYLPVGRILNSFLGLAVSLIVAEVSYRYVEQPIIRRGRQWSQRRREREAGKPS